MPTRIRIERVDPFTLASRGAYDDATTGGSITWDASDEGRVSGSLPFLGELPGRGDMLRVMREDDTGAIRPLATCFWRYDGRLGAGAQAGELSLISPLVALSGALTDAPYVIAAGARSQQVIEDICRRAWRPLTIASTTGDARYEVPVVYDVGTPLSKIAQDAAAAAGLIVSVDEWGFVTLVDQAAAASWSWTDMPGVGSILGRIDRSTSFFDSPTAVIASWGDSDESVSATATLSGERSAQALGRRIESRIDVQGAAGASYPALLGIAERQLAALDVTESWRFASEFTEARIHERATITSTAEGATLSGVIQHIEMSLDGLTSCSIQVNGVVM